MFFCLWPFFSPKFSSLERKNRNGDQKKRRNKNGNKNKNKSKTSVLRNLCRKSLCSTPWERSLTKATKNKWVLWFLSLFLCGTEACLVSLKFSCSRLPFFDIFYWLPSTHVPSFFCGRFLETVQLKQTKKSKREEEKVKEKEKKVKKKGISSPSCIRFYSIRWIDFFGSICAIFRQGGETTKREE
mmetsp:Transcript_6166/g.15203  ORF Transcript_6166/g.15203 Transcript_6166/m.15203 type:complete len:185 (-) Transcript_6166:3692-4246(-)